MPIYFLVDRISGTQVRADLGLASCSCDDFRTGCSCYEPGDPRRLCQHLKEAFAIEQAIRTSKILKGPTGELRSRIQTEARQVAGAKR